MNYQKKLIVKPDTNVNLKDFDPSWHGHHEKSTDADQEIASFLVQMNELQRMLYAEKKHALLIVLQGIDAAGKDGVCWHVISGMSPQGVKVVGFKQPTSQEREHDFLWRVHPHTPGLGQVAVFNRSYYEDVLVARVHKIVPKSVWASRYDRINEFEQLLHESGVTILKFFLWISPEEQLKRFAQRLNDPMRHWKISESDYSERDLWNDYVKAYEAMLEKCSTDIAPWFVIPSNHKWFRNLAISQIICSTMSDMKMQLPATTVDLKKIKALYHDFSLDPSDPEKAILETQKKKKKKK